MKQGIHPEYVTAIVHCACGNTFHTRATKHDLHVEAWSASSAATGLRTKAKSSPTRFLPGFVPTTRGEWIKARPLSSDIRCGRTKCRFDCSSVQKLGGRRCRKLQLLA